LQAQITCFTVEFISHRVMTKFTHADEDQQEEKYTELSQNESKSNPARP